MGVGLVISLQPWDTLLIYCNNQFKKYITPLLRLARGALSIPTLMSKSEAFYVPFHFNKTLLYKSSCWSSLVPGPKAKSSSSEIKHQTPFTVSYQKQLRCPSTDEWIKMKWYIYTTEYHFAKKRMKLSQL